MNTDVELTRILDHLRAARDSARSLGAETLAYLIGVAIDEAEEIRKGVFKLPGNRPIDSTDNRE